MTISSILLIGAALLGLVVGSFLNALSFRFNTGQPFFSKRGMGGRSRCMHCGHELSALDLVPLLSFIFLGGTCRYCSAKISWQYPLVELVAAILSLLVYMQNPVLAGYSLQPLPFIFWFVVWMTLLFVVIYDIKHTIIPWSCSGLLALLGFAALFVNLQTLQFGVPGIWVVLAGPLLALPLFLLSLFSGGTWMGWGDSALELGLGWLFAGSVGISAGATAFMLAFWIGAVVGVVLLLLSRAGLFGYTIKSEIPFAPFLVLGAVLAYFFHVDFSQPFQRSSKGVRAMSKGFTLIEMLVVITIMLIITTILLFNQSRFDSSTVLRSLAYGVALSVRQAQVYGTSVVGTSTTQAACGNGLGSYSNGNCYASAYGLYFSNALSTAVPSSYVLFADLNGDGLYEPNEFVKSFTLGTGYNISNFCATNQFAVQRCEPSSISSLTIIFKRPNPDAQFIALDGTGNPIVGDSYSSAYVQIQSNGDVANSKSVTVTLPGEVSVCVNGTSC